MVNIVLTKACNRACSFCFADVRGATSSDIMPMERYLATLDRIVASGMREARILGGEPTLHPQFIEMADAALVRGMQVTVFTGGLLQRGLVKALAERRCDRLTLVVNVVQPFEGSQAQAQRRLFASLGTHCLLGITIERPGTDFGFLLELQASYCMIPRIRFGLAHPTLNADNCWLHPKHYAVVGRRVAAFWSMAAAQGVILEFDCGWTPCMFPDDVPGELRNQMPDIGQRCSPIIDVLPDATAIHCFPLAKLPAASTPFDAPPSELRARLSQQISSWRAATIYRECETCRWRQDRQCASGCLAAAMRRCVALPPGSVCAKNETAEAVHG